MSMAEIHSQLWALVCWPLVQNNSYYPGADGPIEILCGHEILFKNMWFAFFTERWFILSWDSYSIQKLGGTGWENKVQSGQLFFKPTFSSSFLLTSPLCLSARHTDPSRRCSHVPCTLDFVLLCHVASLPGMLTRLYLGAPLSQSWPNVTSWQSFPKCPWAATPNPMFLWHYMITISWKMSKKKYCSPISLSMTIVPQDYKMLQIIIYFIFQNDTQHEETSPF